MPEPQGAVSTGARLRTPVPVREIRAGNTRRRDSQPADHHPGRGFSTRACSEIVQQTSDIPCSRFPKLPGICVFVCQRQITQRQTERPSVRIVPQGRALAGLPKPGCWSRVKRGQLLCAATAHRVAEPTDRDGPTAAFHPRRSCAAVPVRMVGPKNAVFRWLAYRRGPGPPSAINLAAT